MNNPFKMPDGTYYFRVGPFPTYTEAIDALLKYIVWKDRTPWQRLKVLAREFWNDTRGTSKGQGKQGPSDAA